MRHSWFIGGSHGWNEQVGIKSNVSLHYPNQYAKIRSQIFFTRAKI